MVKILELINDKKNTVNKLNKSKYTTAQFY